jgi:hypothetical protein
MTVKTLCIGVDVHLDDLVLRATIRPMVTKS